MFNVKNIRNQSKFYSNGIMKSVGQSQILVWKDLYYVIRILWRWGFVLNSFRKHLNLYYYCEEKIRWSLITNIWFTTLIDMECLVQPKMYTFWYINHISFLYLICEYNDLLVTTELIIGWTLLDTRKSHVWKFQQESPT